MLGVFAEFETNLRKERQLEGIAAAKARGVYKGRLPTIDPGAVRRLAGQGIGGTEIARQLKISRASVYRLLEAAAGVWDQGGAPCEAKPVTSESWRRRNARRRGRRGSPTACSRPRPVWRVGVRAQPRLPLRRGRSSQSWRAVRGSNGGCARWSESVFHYAGRSSDPTFEMP